MPFLTPFLVGRVPLLKSTTENKSGSLILTSLLEDLAGEFSGAGRQGRFRHVEWIAARFLQ